MKGGKEEKVGGMGLAAAAHLAALPSAAGAVGDPTETDADAERDAQIL